MAGVDVNDMFHRVGQLTRTLHDALHELGYDRKLELAVQAIPDTRDRLNYIATLTGQAAERALTSVERAQSVQQSLAAEAAGLSAQWDQLYAGAMPVDEFKQLAQRTREHLAAMPGRVDQTRAELHEIMMAQDFHDLTGQVINRVIALAQSMEAELLKLLVQARPSECSVTGNEEWLTGPAMNVGARADVVANQAQVDDLLESLGF
jgi:chemotaxis protein CheZ